MVLMRTVATLVPLGARSLHVRAIARRPASFFSRRYSPPSLCATPFRRAPQVELSTAAAMETTARADVAAAAADIGAEFTAPTTPAEAAASDAIPDVATVFEISDTATATAVVARLLAMLSLVGGVLPKVLAGSRPGWRRPNACGSI